MTKHGSESLGFIRLMMVLGSMTPLFVLWAIRGTPLVEDWILWTLCIVMIGIPNVAIYGRTKIAQHEKDYHPLKVMSVEDHRDHLLVYLFAVLLPLYVANLSAERELWATLVAFLFIIFLFWHLNLHYMNLVYALCGYRVYTMRQQHRLNCEGECSDCAVLLTKRHFLIEGQTIRALRLSNTVYIELGGKADVPAVPVEQD